MPCYKPLVAFQPLEGGQLVFAEKKGCREVQIPCGQCIGCRIEKVDAWGFRCMAEASLHRHNHFVTLTYSDEHLPDDESLNHRDWQLFAKRLRERVGPFRFFMCGEYGDQFKRPHFHALLFGIDLPELRKLNSVYSTHDVYSCEVLGEAWGKGFHTIGTVTHESAKYVASYVLKRCSDEVAAERFAWVTRFGEVVERTQPYGRMSLKPGIGAKWIEKYWRDCVNHGAVYDGQYRKKIPPFFGTLIEKIDPKAAEDLEALVTERGMKYCKPEDNTRERLQAKEACRKAAVSFKKERFPNAL